MTLAGLSPVGVLHVRSNEPFALHVGLADADGDLQDLTGRLFKVVFRYSTQPTPFLELDGELDGEALRSVMFGTAENASVIYDAGVSKAVSYDVMEVTGGASISKYTSRVTVSPGPDLPTDTVPTFVDLPASEALLTPTSLVVTERGAMGHGAAKQMADAGYTDEPTVAALNEYLTAAPVRYATTLSNPAVPVAQTPLYDPFFGFDNGTTNTSIFPGAGRAPQGMASVRHLGVDYEFIAVPAETSGPDVRIVQFERGNPTAIAMTPALTVNHHTLGAYSDGTDIFIVFASGPYDDPLAEEGAEFPNYNRGKSLAILPWSGADTVSGDISLYRLFDDQFTTHYGSRYFNASITCSNDGVYIIVSGNDYAAYDRTNAARHVFVFRRAEIVAAGADARGVMPINRFDMEHPDGYDCNCYQDLTCARDPVTGLYNLAAFVGRIPVFAPQALLIFNLFGDGKPVRTIYYDGIRAKYQRAGLLDYATGFPDEDDIGIPRSTEGEGISYDADGNLLTLTIDDWIAPGAIVTYGGQNWALRSTSSGYSALGSPSPDYWVLTSKAANAGAYTVDAVYTAPGNSTRRAKVIYKVAIATGAEGEQPCDGGIQVPRNTARISFGQDWRDMDFPRGSDLLIGCVDNFTNEWKRRLRLTDGGGHQFYDGDPTANNNTYGHIAYIDRPTEKELRINSRSYGRAFGSSLYLYPPDDPRATAGMAELYTGEGHLSIATTAAGKTTLSGTSVVPAVANRSDSGMAATWQRAGVDRAGIYLTTVNFVLSSMAGTVFGIGRRDDGSTTTTPTIDWQLDPTTGAWKPASAGRDLGLSSNKILDAHITTLRLYPPASVTPAANGELTIQATSNTSVTIKLKGSDGTVRSVALTLA